MNPLNNSVKAKRHTKQYQMHKYFARRPYNVFQNIINHYTIEGDMILDCFCGGGVTIYESAALGRIPIGVDLNPLATFITKMQVFNSNLDEVSDLLYEFVSFIKQKYSVLYQINFNDDKGFIEWIEYTYKTTCPDCDQTLLLSEKNKIRNGFYRCSNALCKNHSGIKRLNLIPNGIHPLRVKYRSELDNELRIREYSDIKELEDINEFIKNFDFDFIPDLKLPMDMDRQFEDRLFQKGVENYKDLFTERSFYINTMIYNDILRLKKSLSEEHTDILYFLFSSSLRYTNNMTRVTENWEGGKPTSMDKHAFWLPSQFIENNIIKVIESRVNSIISGFKFSSENLNNKVSEKSDFNDLLDPGDFLILNRSSDNLPIPNESIDIVITDPPYGSNVQYSELSIIWNVWFQHYKNLPTYLNRDEEAVMNRRLPKDKGAKDSRFYEDMLLKVFSECHRVLKKDKYLVFTFNNKNINVWISMLRAVRRAGFTLPKNGIIYQDYIESYKNTAHLRYSGNLHGDFIYSFKKSDINISSQNSNSEITLSQSIESTISNFAKDMVKSNINYTTTILYQELLTILTQNIMDFLEDEPIELDNFGEDLSDKHIDQILSKYLKFENETWKAKK